MLSQKQVDFFAHQSGIQNVLVAEREIVLTYALRMLSDSEFAEHFAFKGGTCIRKLWLGPTGRFSMDLDFTARKYVEPDDAIVNLMELFNSEYHGITFTLEDNWRTTQDGRSFTATPSYQHDWNSKGGFDLQVSLREEPTLTVVKKSHIPQSYFKMLEFAPPEVISLDEHEILAEKIRAAYQRAKVRDLHDLFVYSTKPLDRDLIRRLAVIKLWQGDDIFEPEKLYERLGQESEYDWADLRQLVRGVDTIDPKKIIRDTVAGYQFLAKFTVEEAELASDGRSHRKEELRDQLVESCRARRATGGF